MNILLKYQVKKKLLTKKTSAVFFCYKVKRCDGYGKRQCKTKCLIYYAKTHKTLEKKAIMIYYIICKNI